MTRIKFNGCLISLCRYQCWDPLCSLNFNNISAACNALTKVNNFFLHNVFGVWILTYQLSLKVHHFLSVFFNSALIFSQQQVNSCQLLPDILLSSKISILGFIDKTRLPHILWEVDSTNATSVLHEFWWPNLNVR